LPDATFLDAPIDARKEVRAYPSISRMIRVESAASR
jgi:hypothetical protein